MSYGANGKVMRSSKLRSGQVWLNETPVLLSGPLSSAHLRSSSLDCPSSPRDPLAVSILHIIALSLKGICISRNRNGSQNQYNNWWCGRVRSERVHAIRVRGYDRFLIRVSAICSCSRSPSRFNRSRPVKTVGDLSAWLRLDTVCQSGV